MACKICKTLKLKKLRRLNKQIKIGKKSIMDLAEEFTVSPKVLIKHQELCLKPKQEDDGYLTLTKLLKQVKKDMKAARNDALYGDEDTGKGASMFYTILLKEARELVAAIEKQKPNEEITREIQATVVVPFITELAHLMVEEGSNLQAELQAILGDNFDQNIKRALKETWQRMSKRLSTEHDRIEGRLTSVIGRDRGKPIDLDSNSLLQRTSQDLH